LHAATVQAALRVAVDGAISVGAVSASVATLAREVMASMFLIKMGWIAGLSLILAVGGWSMAGQPADEVDQLRANLARSRQPHKEPEARELAKPIETRPNRVSEPSPEVARSVRKIVDQLRERPLRPARPRAGLFLLDTVTEQVRRIADEPDAGLTHCGSPCWSWDGTRILFDATPGNDYGSTRLKAIDLTDEGPKITDLGPGNCPSLSPNGRDLAIMDNPGGGVAVMRTDGADRRRVGPYGRPTWSPDGRRILIAGIQNPCPVWLVSPEGDLEQPIQVEGQDFYVSPSWVDEATIVAVIGPDLVGTAIALLDVTEPSEAKVKEILWKRGSDLNVMPSCPVYSAHTGRLIFAGSDPRGMTALYSLRRGQAGRPRRLEPDVENKELIDLAGSPDGHSVLFCSDRP